ncbi:hypothetical protein FRB95_013075 [Tulasnella sp. JGI-2019a]|nr:hypothetical protein FRB95_013075 [Tulasnella sp. JGI-2019a]
MISAVKSDIQLTGLLETNPIELAITASEMDSIMTVLHARQTSAPLHLTIEQWSDALHIATLWNLTAICEYIINRITTLFPEQNPIDRILLADQCRVEKWLHPAYQELCTMTNAPSRKDGLDRLGVDRIISIFTIREALRVSPPPLKSNDILPCPRCDCNNAINVTEPRSSSQQPQITCRSCKKQLLVIQRPSIVSGETAMKMIKEAKELKGY